MAQHLIFPLVGVEVERMPGIGDLSGIVAAARRPEQVGTCCAFSLRRSFRQYWRPGLGTLAVAQRPSGRLRVEEIDRLARGVVEDGAEFAVRSDDRGAGRLRCAIGRG